MTVSPFFVRSSACAIVPQGSFGHPHPGWLDPPSHDTWKILELTLGSDDNNLPFPRGVSTRGAPRDAAMRPSYRVAARRAQIQRIRAAEMGARVAFRGQETISRWRAPEGAKRLYPWRAHPKITKAACRVFPHASLEHRILVLGSVSRPRPRPEAPKLLSAPQPKRSPLRLSGLIFLADFHHGAASPSQAVPPPFSSIAQSPGSEVKPALMSTCHTTAPGKISFTPNSLPRGERHTLRRAPLSTQAQR